MFLFACLSYYVYVLI